MVQTSASGAKFSRYVITGAPCTGKTTVINELSRLGYKTIEEPARGVLEKYPELKGPDVSEENVRIRERMILGALTDAERETVGSEGMVFMDGGIPSSLAFFRVHGTEPPTEFIEAANRTNYDGVFMLERLPFYENDEIRRESESDSIRLQELLIGAYADAGYNITMVPMMPPKERAEFILDSIATQ